MRGWGQMGDPFATPQEPGRPARRLFAPLPHWRCECWRCMEVRDVNQAVRQMMGWRQPDYRPRTLDGAV